MIEIMRLVATINPADVLFGKALMKYHARNSVVEPGDWLYHGTNVENIPNIMKKGLLPTVSKFADWHEGKPVLYAVLIAGRAQLHPLKGTIVRIEHKKGDGWKKMKMYDGILITEKKIPPAQLYVLTEYGWQGLK